MGVGANAIAVAELTIDVCINADARSQTMQLISAMVYGQKAYSKADGLLGKKVALIGVGACRSCSDD